MPPFFTGTTSDNLMSNVQVDATHYAFRSYMEPRRWMSVWHQLDELSRLECREVLEVGPGPGVLKLLAPMLGITVITADIDPALKPDHVASVLDLPFASSTFDAVAAFQVLEHLPYETSLQAFAELLRVARSNVIVSLPDARKVWRYEFHVPTIGPVGMLVPRPTFRARPHHFDGQHHWEINKRGYPLDRIVADYTARGAVLRRTYRVSGNPYHRFFVFDKASP
jgi:predicted SAM-dependent methyltransferase